MDLPAAGRRSGRRRQVRVGFRSESFRRSQHGGIQGPPVHRRLQRSDERFGEGHADGFLDLYKDLESPVNLWRMDVDEDGNENFEMLAGEANNKYFGDSKGTSMAIPCCPAWATATSRAVT